MKKISVIIPCYNEEASLGGLFSALIELMNSNNSYNWEILMVNDGSRDGTMDRIKEMRSKDARFCYINLSRNFGKENALLAGIDYASGDCAVIMDADLQHPPHIVPQMIEKWESGFFDVYGKRMSRGKESIFRKSSTSLYYRLIKNSARFDVLPNVGDFRLLDRKCIDALKQLRETERYTKGMFAWIGFEKTYIEFETEDRIAGESHMSIKSLLNLAINGITSYTVAPLKWSIYLGLIVSLSAFLFMIYVLIKTVFFGDPVAGYPTMMIVVLLLGGIQLLSLGILGEYLGKIFYESKRRPVYIASEIEI